MGTIPIMNGQTSLGEKVLRFEGKKAMMALMVIISVVFGTPVCTQCPLALWYPCCFLHEETGLGKLSAQPESHGSKWRWDLPSVRWTSKYFLIEKQCFARDWPLPYK